MKNENNSYRVRTGVGIDAPSHIDVKLDQTFEFLNILSLKIGQKNLYKMPASNYGIICGRVLANKTFGIPNARVSVFIPSENSVFDVKDNILYNYSTVSSSNMDGIRYNLLPSSSNNDCHQTVGSMYEKEFVLDNNDVIKIFDKYYTYTTRTNNAGDYMIYGIPVGRQMLHVDVDLSDIGELSIRPYDMIYKGYNVNQFESPNKFRRDKNLNRLPQIFTQDKGVYVYPFWGDTSDDDTNASITRCDIEIDYKFEPTCVFMGSIISDTGSASISHKCVPDDKVGKMSELITGEGRIEMIRKTFDGKVEEFSVMGNRLIDGNGVWCYQIPMNLDYVRTDEFGNIVPTDNPDTGIPTRARVRFRISMDEPGTDDTARKRARFLVPNNPRKDGKNNGIYPEFQKTHEPDYEFGSRTKEESYRDLFWNNVYTVKSYIPRLQKKRSPASRKFTGFKMINHFGDNNPLPYNNLFIRMGFVYRFLCSLLTMFIVLVASLNTIIATIGYILLGLAYSLDVLGYILGVAFGWIIEIISIFSDDSLDITDFNVFKGLTCAIYSAIPKMFIQISNLCEEDTMVFVPGAGAWVTGCIKAACQTKEAYGCDNVNTNTIEIGSNNSESTQDFRPQEISINEDGSVGKDKDKADLCTLSDGQWTTEIDSLLNCIQNELVQDNDVTSFNFQDDWINGVLYAPLWYRKIKPKRKVFFGLIQIGGTDVWCDSEIPASKPSRKNLKLYNTCVQNRVFKSSNEISPLNRDPEKSIDSQCSNNKCHRQKTYLKVDNGVIVRKETKLGEFVYYYRSVEYDENIKISPINNGNGDVKILFATDIVLLGNLRECNSLGIPQFFKHLESSTYKMPPDLVSVDYEGDANSYDDNNEDEYSGEIQDWHTEFTGADWGNAGVDQNYRLENSRYQERGDGVKDGDYNKHDNGGLFYGLNCVREYVKPKSCINLSRLCEFGVSLDQSILFNNGQQMPPDGFVSYDEIYNMDARSMFATMNSNGLRTVINSQTGFPVYCFNTLYADNFDGSLHNIMNGIPDTNDKGLPLLYKNNYLLETSSEAYLRFRYGFLPNTSDFGVTFYEKNGQSRFPRYENSFYFYFGLKEGKTAIDKFRSTYYAECSNESDSESVLKIKYRPNSWCLNESDDKDDLDGYVNLDLSDMALPITLSVKDELTNEEIVNITLRNEGYKFYIGHSDTSNSGYYCLNNEFPNTWDGLRNGVYTIYITDGEDNQQQETINFQAPKLDCDLSVTNFVGNIDALKDMLDNPNLTPCDILRNATPPDTSSTLKRMIGGYITIENISNGSSDDYEIEIMKDGGGDCPEVVYYTDSGTSSPSNAFFDPPTASPVLPRVIGVSEPNKYYIVTIREKCDNIEDGYLETNEFSQKVYVAADTELKMYVNDVDYDLIKDFRTGYTNGGSGDVTDNPTESVIGWLDFSEEIGPLHELELSSTPTLPTEVDYLIVTTNNCPYTLTEEYYFNETEFFEENINLYSNTPEFIESNEFFGRVGDAIEYDFYQNEGGVATLKPNFGINDYYVNSSNPDETDERRLTVLNALNEIIARRLELLKKMRKAFFFTGSKTLEVTANKTPFNTLMYYVEDVEDPDEDYRDLDQEYHQINTKGGISIPTIDFDGQFQVICSGTDCQYQHKRPYYVGVRYKNTITVPGELGIETGGFVPGSHSPQLHSVNMVNMFGVHMIDKTPKFEGIIWQPMVEYPIYGATDSEYQGAYMTMDGLIAGHIYNLFSTSNDRTSAEFVSQQLGSEDVKIYTVTVKSDDVTPNEYAIPTERYIYNERNYNNDPYNQYLDYRIDGSTVSSTEPWKQQYMSVRENSDTLFIRDVDETYFISTVKLSGTFGIPENRIIEDNDIDYLRELVFPTTITINQDERQMSWYVRNDNNPIYEKYMNGYNHTPDIMKWDAVIDDEVTTPITSCYFIGVTDDGTYRVITPTYEVAPIDVHCSDDDGYLKIEIDDILNNCYYLQYFDFNVYTDSQKITSQGVQSATIITNYSWADYLSNNPQLYIKDITGIKRKLNVQS